MHGSAHVFCSSSDVETSRLAELESLEILDTEPERRFDIIARLASTILGTPIALVSLVGRERQWFKSRVGLAATETPREVSFCAHTLERAEALVVLDARRDPRFAENSLVTGAPHIRFYAGAPLITSNGHHLGALCVADNRPRDCFSDGHAVVLRDLATLVVEQLELRRSERRRSAMVSFAEATDLAFLVVGANGAIQFANRSATELFGYVREEMVGSSAEIIVPERLRTAHRRGMERVVAGGDSKLSGRTVEVVARRKDASEFPIELSLSVWTSEAGVGLGAIIRDVSARRERDDRLLRLANKDGLTGLSNRRRFEDALRELFEQRRNAAVVLFDLDGFKQVNDTLGHAVGDDLLQFIAVRIATQLGETALLARFGGDEFAVLLPDCSDPLAADECGREIISHLSKPFEVDRHVMIVGASAGFALGPDHGVDAEELLASADYALYRAKKEGGGRVRMFSPDMRHAATRKRAYQDEVLSALQQGDLVLYYQPQISLATGRISGVEALIRWRHPERGLLLPGTFLPAIEDSAIALQVGTWVLEEACRQSAAWRHVSPAPPRIGVNLFSNQFQSCDLAATVLETLRRHGVDPSSLEIEITERIALQNEERALDAVHALRTAGVRIAFDDFGTGYASLSWLQRFPIDTLKIDRSFVSNLLMNTSDAAITRGIITMSRELGLTTVAEGIETIEQEATLRAFGCDHGQGFLYARAVAADVITERLFELRNAKYGGSRENVTRKLG